MHFQFSFRSKDYRAASTGVIFQRYGWVDVGLFCSDKKVNWTFVGKCAVNFLILVILREEERLNPIIQNVATVFGE